MFMHMTALGFASVIVCGIAMAPLLVETDQLLAQAMQTEMAPAVAIAATFACNDAPLPSRTSVAVASGCVTDTGTKVADAR
jgi:hypothetical protein